MASKTPVHSCRVACDLGDDCRGVARSTARSNFSSSSRRHLLGGEGGSDSGAWAPKTPRSESLVSPRGVTVCSDSRRVPAFGPCPFGVGVSKTKRIRHSRTAAPE